MPFTTDIKKVLALANPITDPPWECGLLLDPSDVHDAIAAQEMLDRPVSPSEQDNFLFHARRIAWLYVHGWQDPIHIDVGVPSHGCFPLWPVEDGNHRLYAAALRGDREIKAVVSGALDHAAELLGVEVESLVEEQDNES